MRIRLPLCCLFALSACARPSTATIEATGTLEVVEVDISPISAGRVSRVLVDEGAAVRAGDTLAVLIIPTLPSDVAQREAKASSANAAFQEAEHGPRAAEIASAAAELGSAEATADRAARDVERLRPLAAKQNVSAQDFDAARALAASTAGHRDALRAQLQLLREGTRPERIHAAEADARGASASVASALATERDLVLVSPVTGTVTNRSAEPGEVIGAGQAALTVAQTGRQTVRVYVSEAVLPRIRAGQAVRALLDAFPDHEFTGRVVAISTQAEYTPRVALTEKERADLLFGVKVEFSDSTGMLKAGLPITVRIDAPVPAAKP
ncbi:MAG: HlyD family secretion protein [Gemmatimonadales bacterium]